MRAAGGGGRLVRIEQAPRSGRVALGGKMGFTIAPGTGASRRAPTVRAPAGSTPPDYVAGEVRDGATGSAGSDESVVPAFERCRSHQANTK